jgi:hypothetical protein
MFRSIPILTAVLFFSSCACSSAVTFEVQDFGAKADGETDDTAAFQAAIQAAEEAGGGTVHAPAGRYLCQGNIVIRPTVRLQGDYFGNIGRHGTTLLAKAGKETANGPAFIRLIGGKNALEGVVIEYPDQIADATQPIPFPYAIHVGPYSLVEDVVVHNPYQGLNLDGAHASIVRNVWGEPLRIGLNADHVHDISRIENIHFWPFFTNGKPLRQWVQDNGVAFQFGRSDWQYCLNTFCFGYHTGYRFYESKDVPNSVLRGGVTNGNFVGIGADRVVHGIDVENCFSIGVSITNGEFAPFGARRTRGVLLREGNTGNLTLTNCNFWAVPDSLFEVQDGSLNVTGCNIQEWGVRDSTVPCFIAKGGRLNVNGCTFNRGGFLARLEGEETRAVFSANMGTDQEFEVGNQIGKRAVFGLNNPPIEIRETKAP